MKFGAAVLGLVAMAIASPALAQGQVEGGSKAIWMALGVAFIGVFIAIFSSVMAASGAAKKKSDQASKD